MGVTVPGDGFSLPAGGFAARRRAGYPGGGFQSEGGGFALPGVAPWYPLTANEFRARTGKTPDAIRLYDEASGNVDDKVGGNDLVVVNTPTFRQATNGRRGIYYDGLTDSHRADVHDFGTASWVMAFVWVTITDPGHITGVMGRTNAGLDPGAFVYLQSGSSTTVSLQVKDDGSNAIVLFPSFNPRSPVTPILGMLQGGRGSDATFRYRFQRHGQTPTAGTASLSGWGSLSGASMLYGPGALNGSVGAGACLLYDFVLTGAQCEGADVLPGLARDLGWN